MFVFSGKPLYTKRSFIGETVHLSCGDVKASNSEVDWYYEKILIISGGKLTNGDFQGRLSASGSTLIIEKATKNDSGIYTCKEDIGQGPSHRLDLTVHGEFRELFFMLMINVRN